jgi:addiction module RelB/DinJ family antitoxin
MNTAVIIAKTEPQVKIKAQKIAKDLGLSLSSLINAWLRQLIKTKTVVFSAVSKSEEPTQYLLDSLRESKRDIKAGRVSPSFDNADDAINWLEDPNAVYQNGDKAQR